jgi:thiosulfate/3-mercaptopyruvate sulfurtransferase
MLAPVLALAGTLAAAPVAADTAVPVLVTPEWLAGHLDDPDLVVLHVAQLRSDYDREHIPGARFV